jgi:hypothetical protein
MNPLKAALSIAYVCSIFYCVVLSTSGIAERRLLEREFQQIADEVERLAVENQVLEEREKRLQNDAYALEKEARKYYLLSENAHVLKFVERKTQTVDSNNIPKAADLRINISVKEPSLFLLRFFYFSFSVFLCLGVYFKLKSLPPTSNPKRLN